MPPPDGSLFCCAAIWKLASVNSTATRPDEAFVAPRGTLLRILVTSSSDTQDDLPIVLSDAPPCFGWLLQCLRTASRETQASAASHPRVRPARFPRSS